MPRIRPIRFLGFALDTIYGVDGEHDTPYMTRATIGRLRFHIFWRGDADPDPHDHPWGFWTFPLTTYMEEVAHGPISSTWHTQAGPIQRTHIFKTTEVVRSWRLHYRPATHCHRVLGRAARKHGGRARWDWHLWPGPVVTVVWREKESRAWGFLKLRDGRWCWQDWKAYVFEGGKNAPCEK